MFFTGLSFMTTSCFSLDSAIPFLFIISLSFSFLFLFVCVCAHARVCVQTRRKKKRKKKMRKMGLWLIDLVPNDWDLCSKSFIFFPSIPFSNLDPIPLHCSCHCNFFILLLLLLLFSCVFSFFTANALHAFNFVSFKFSYLIFIQWCQMVRWNYETLKSVEYFSNLFLVSIHFHQPCSLCS